MPNSYSYPGVYLEEIPSGVRTISGVSTSDTAFVGFFGRGPMNEPVRITSFTDFERYFGGLHTRSEASYAIQQYYLNGGQIAWVVRVASGYPQAAELILYSGSPIEETLLVEAANPGVWGNNVQVAIDSSPDHFVFDMFVEEKLQDDRVVNREVYYDLSMETDSLTYVVNVINNQSALIRVTEIGLGEIPNKMDFTSLESGDDGDTPEGTDLTDGMKTLDTIAPYVFNILCLPAAANLNEDQLKSVYEQAITYCETKRGFLIVDIPAFVTSVDGMTKWMTDVGDGIRHKNAAVYFPRLEIANQLKENRLRHVGASGTLAGVYARTDATRGVWKAPAGLEAILRGARPLVKLTDFDNGALNSLAINVLRTFSAYGHLSWGSRTLDGTDRMASEWKYIPVRRLALYIEESLYQALRWVVFEPNDEPLWSQIRLNVGTFMHDLFRQGAFQGHSAKEAYFVKCDQDTTTQSDIDRGIVNIVVGFAPSKPAEFVVVKLQKIAGQSPT